MAQRRKQKEMIKEDYVSFETAKLLKERGFDEPTGFVYSESGELMKLSDFGVRYLLNSECDDYPHWQFPFEGVSSIVSAPTIQMAMKWLREKKGIAIIPVLSSVLDNEKFLWDVKIVVAKTSESYSQGWIYEKQEEACEAAIKYCLENLI